LAELHALPVYDASYLELALRLTAPLATVDKALAFAAQRVGLSSPVLQASPR
jgi:predicted nucleic acid-binding protein